MKKILSWILGGILVVGLVYAAQTTVNTSSDTFQTAWDRQQAMNSELYALETSKQDTLTNEAGLYAALNDVSNFLQEADFSANGYSLVTSSTYASMRGLLDLEAGIDFYSMSAADAAFEGILTNEAGLYSALNDVTDFVQPGDSPSFAALTVESNTIDFGDVTEDYVLTFNASTNTWAGEAASGGGGSVSDAEYGSGWNDDTTTAASKNAIYDKIETIAGGTMTYPGAGIPLSTGSAWDTSYSIATLGAALEDDMILSNMQGAVTDGQVPNDITITNLSGTNTGDQDLSTYVVGPASATDNTLPRYDSTTGKLIQGSGIAVDDSNNVSGMGTLSSGAITSTGLTVTGTVDLGSATLTFPSSSVTNAAMADDSIDTLEILNDAVNDTKIDWGTGTNQVSAVDLPIADSGSIITATDVEAALQEHRTAINLNTAKTTNATHTGDVAGSGELTIQDDAVEGSMIIADAIDGTKIVDDAIDSEHYAAASIDSEHLSVGAVDNLHTFTATAANNFSNGSIGYVVSAGTVSLTDASAESTSNGLLCFSTGTISGGASGTFRLRGMHTQTSHGYTVGAALYLSETAGEITTTAPTTSAAIIRIVGYAVDANTIMFCPDNTFIELN